jgi:hypothetical protein
MYPLAGYRNVFAQTDINVTAVTKIGLGVRRRSAIEIKNHDPVNNLWVSKVQKGSGAPTMTSTSHIYSIYPGQTLMVFASESIDVYVAPSGGAIAATYQESAY